MLFEYSKLWRVIKAFIVKQMICDTIIFTDCRLACASQQSFVDCNYFFGVNPSDIDDFGALTSGVAPTTNDGAGVDVKIGSL